MEEGSGSSLNQSVVNKILSPNKHNRKREFELGGDCEDEARAAEEFNGMPSTGENGQPAQQPQLAQRPSSEDIRNFIGNIYLGDGNCIGEEFTSPSIKQLRALDEVTKEVIFLLSNFHRLFLTKFRTHSIITHKLVSIIEVRIDESEWFLIPTIASLQHWSVKMLAFLKKILPPMHPDLIQFYKFQQQIGPESEVLKNLVNRAQLISTTLRNRLLENGDYWILEAHINAAYGRFSKTRSALFHLLSQADRAKLLADLNALSFDPDHNYFSHEFSILSAVRFAVELLKKDGHSAIDTLDEIQIMQEFLTRKCKDVLASLRKLSELPQVQMDLDLLNTGLLSVGDLERGSSHIDFPKLLGDSATEFIKKRGGCTGPDPTEVSEWVTLIRKFFSEYSMKYPKHTPLIRHQVQCSTTGTHKNCLLILDVAPAHPDIQQPDPRQRRETGKAQIQSHQERPRQAAGLCLVHQACQSPVDRLQNTRKTDMHRLRVA